MAQESVMELRIQSGWSQSELAELSGLSVKTIQRIEKGQGAPSSETAKALASVFGRPFSDFLHTLSSTEASEQKRSDSAACAEIAASQVSADVPAKLLHDALFIWVTDNDIANQFGCDSSCTEGAEQERLISVA